MSDQIKCGCPCGENCTCGDECACEGCTCCGQA